MEQYEFKCPYCGEQVIWEEGDPTSFSCMSCDGSCVVVTSEDGTHKLEKEDDPIKFTCPYCGEPVLWKKDDATSFMCDKCNGPCKVIKLEDGNYKLVKEEDEEDDAKWDLLVHQILNGDIIPVIGEDIVLNGNRTVRQILINSMCRTDGIDLEEGHDLSHDGGSDNVNKRHFSYSQLIYHPHYTKEKEHIYDRIKKLVEKYEKQFKASDLLKRVLSIKQFPFIITVSSDPVTENAMKRIWKERGREVKTLIFNNDPKEIDKKGDISRDSDIENPTIYYMFGKADTNVPHRFVVTDEDMLSFCQSWLTEGRRPKILSRVVGSKSLLFLGCNYPDWLVRFIWYSMRENLEKSGMLVGESLEPSLEDFMKRVHIETQKDPQHVIEQIESRLAMKMEELDTTRFDAPGERTDVFISYSRNNETQARLLYDEFAKKGLNAWYDRKNLAAGDRWLPKIKDAIESTKFFVALISESMKSQTNESHVYRREWNMAIECAKGMGSRRGFIIPVALDGIDIHAERKQLDLPDELPGHNALSISSETDYMSVANEILKRINNLSK